MISADPRLLVRPTPPAPAPLPEVETPIVWEPCTRCGGQRREFAYQDSRWAERPCTISLGIGSVLA